MFKSSVISAVALTTTIFTSFSPAQAQTSDTRSRPTSYLHTGPNYTSGGYSYTSSSVWTQGGRYFLIIQAQPDAAYFLMGGEKTLTLQHALDVLRAEKAAAGAQTSASDLDLATEILNTK